MTTVRAYDDRRITAHSRHNILSRAPERRLQRCCGRWCWVV